jgi:hypothetical protein
MLCHSHPTIPDALSRAVASSAAALGLRYASAHSEGPCLYVCFRSPRGHLMRTEAAISVRAALSAFERAVMSAIIYQH